MDKLELAWQNFDFCTTLASQLEDDEKSNFDYFRKFTRNHLNPSQTKKTFVRNKLNKYLNQRLIAYKKQIDSIDDLIILSEEYDNDEIPSEYEINLELFYSLKETTILLIEQIKNFRKEINEVLR